MLRLSRFLWLSKNQFQASHTGGSWTPHHRKQAFRQGKAALQESRHRQHLQQDRFQQQQSINQDHGELARERAKQQRQLQSAAMTLAYGGGRAQRRRTSSPNQAPARVTAADRARDMATAREYLQLAEASRKQNKKSRYHRTQEFRATKRWS